MFLLRAGHLVLTSLNFFNFPKSRKVLWDEFWGMPLACCEVGHKGHSAFTPENNAYGPTLLKIKKNFCAMLHSIMIFEN